MLAIAGTVCAQGGKTFSVEFESQGTREVWVMDRSLTGDMSEPQSVSGKAVQIATPEVTKDKVVVVHDLATGDVAVKPLDDVLKSGRWKVAEDEAKLTYAITFLVQHDSKPVAAAIVHLKFGDKTLDSLVTDSDKGVATFRLVPFGDVQAWATYKFDDKDASTAPQTFESKSGMAKAEPLALTITDDVATIQEKPKEETGSKSESGEKEGGEKGKEESGGSSAFGVFFRMLIGLIVVGGIAYAVWRFIVANPDQTAAGLKKMGVNVPADHGDPTISTPKKTGPPQQIILGDADPTGAPPIAMPGAYPAAGPVAGPIVKNPRLVKADGSVFIIQDGTQAVGREADNPLAIGGESSVSRHHANLVREGDSVSVADAGSTNGTFVNGRQISGPTQLAPGDSVQFGAVQYRYEE